MHGAEAGARPSSWHAWPGTKFKSAALPRLPNRKHIYGTKPSTHCPNIYSTAWPLSQNEFFSHFPLPLVVLPGVF